MLAAVSPDVRRPQLIPELTVFVIFKTWNADGRFVRYGHPQLIPLLKIVYIKSNFAEHMAKNINTQIYKLI